MKITYRIPSKEPYGYVEIESEVDNTLSIGTIVKDLEFFMAQAKGEKAGAGLPPKEWNDWLVHYLMTQKGNADQYNRMSKVQKDQIQELKKAFSRIKSKTDPEIE